MNSSLRTRLSNRGVRGAISALPQSIRGLLQGRAAENSSAHLARGSMGSFALKIAYSGLNFIIGIFLARWLGAAGFGAYAYALSWIVVLSAPSGLGFDKLVIRDVAAFKVEGAWGKIRGLLRYANRLTLAVSIGLGLAIGLLSQLFLSNADSQIIFTFWVSLLLLPMLNLTRVRQAAMQGLGDAIRGQMPELLIYPFLFLVFVLITGFGFNAYLSAPVAMGLGNLAAAIALGIGIFWLNRKLPKTAQEEPVAGFALWTRSMIPLVLMSALQILNGRIATLALGSLQGTQAVGIYAVASRGAEYITFFMTAMLPALAPTIASLYKSNDLARLQRVITTSSRIAFGLSVPIGLGFIVFGYWYLSLYGQDFTAGQTALAILSVGQLVNVASGCVGYVLIMTGHERDATWSVGVSILVNVLLCMTLIPGWGIEGAAIADASSLVVWNLLMVACVYKRLRIHSTALGALRLR